METKAYADWGLKVHQESVGRRTPLNGTIEVTRRCNLRCAHCYHLAGQERVAVDLAKAFRARGHTSLVCSTVTGGELVEEPLHGENIHYAFLERAGESGQN